MKSYILESRTVAKYRAKRASFPAVDLPSKRETVSVRVIPMCAAHSEVVSFALDSGFAVLITKPKKFHGYDIKALQSLFGYLGKVSGVFNYGKQVAVLIHKASFPPGHGLKFSMHYPLESFVKAGLEVTNIVLEYDREEILSFSYRVNYLPAVISQSQLNSLEGLGL
jgi:hypothetical protein